MEAEYKKFVADMKDKAMSFKGNALAVSFQLYLVTIVYTLRDMSD